MDYSIRSLPKRAIVPLERGADVDLARWLARESFENVAGDLGMTVTEYAEIQLPAEEAVSLKAELDGKSLLDVAKHFDSILRRPLADFDWWVFSAVLVGTTGA